MDVYVRSSQRYIGNKLVNAFDIASISVDEDWQHRGVFSAFIARVENIARDRGAVVYVESVLNPILSDFLRRKGYSELTYCESCFWKKP
jgi:GNAT superfamily N-acetyltransferase